MTRLFVPCLLISLIACTANGQILAEQPVSDPTYGSVSSQKRPSIAYSGRDYLVAWFEEENSDIVFARVSVDGEHLDGAGIRIPGVWPIVNSSPKVTFDGFSYVLAWVDSSDTVRVARIDPDTGAMLDQSGIVIDQSRGVNSLAIATDHVSTLIVWADTQADSSHSVRAVQLNRYLQIIDFRTISPPSMSAGNPAIAWNGTEWLVEFEEQYWEPQIENSSLYPTKILAVRLSALMTVLDPEPIVIDPLNGPLGESYGNAIVASDGDDFLIVWSAFNTVRARYFKNGSFVSQTATIANGWAMDATWDGERYAVAIALPPSANEDVVLTHVGRPNEPVMNDRLAVGTTLAFGMKVSIVSPGDGVIVVAYPRFATEPLYGGVWRIFVRTPTPFRTRAVRAR